MTTPPLPSGQTRIQRQAQKEELDNILVWINRTKWLSTGLATLSIGLMVLQWLMPGSPVAGPIGSTVLFITAGLMAMSIIATVVLYMAWRSLADRYKVSTKP